MPTYVRLIGLVIMIVLVIVGVIRIYKASKHNKEVTWWEPWVFVAIGTTGLIFMS